MDSALALIHAINQHIINPIIVLIFALAVLVFLYGVFEYFKDSDSSSARETGQRHMLSGVIGMFIMISVFGIITVILNTVGANSTDSATAVHDVTGH